MSAADRTLKSLNGIGDLGTYVNFDDGYKNNVDDSLVQWVNFNSSSGFVPTANTDHSGKSGSNDYNQPSGAGGLELIKSLFKGKTSTAATDREYISLPANVNEEGDFTLSFAVKQKPNKEKADWTGLLFYIGGTDSKDINSGYTIEMQNDSSHSYKHMYIKQNGSSKVTLQRVLLQETDGNGFWHFTIVFDKKDDDKYHLTVYQNDKILPNEDPKENGAYAKDVALEPLDGDISIILGGLDTTEKYDSNNPQVFLDEICIYGEALGESKVHDIYPAINITEESAAESTKAIDEFDNIIATYDSALNAGDQADRAGWYFVNSGSDLNNLYGADVGTAKVLCGLLPNEVIKNEIDLNKLPESVQNYFKTEGKLDDVENGNGGAIATSGKDFTGTGNWFNPDSTKTTDGKPDMGESKKVEKDDTIYYPAITVPDGGRNI